MDGVPSVCTTRRTLAFKRRRRRDTLFYHAGLAAAWPQQFGGPGLFVAPPPGLEPNQWNVDDRPADTHTVLNYHVHMAPPSFADDRPADINTVLNYLVPTAPPSFMDDRPADIDTVLNYLVPATKDEGRGGEAGHRAGTR